MTIRIVKICNIFLIVELNLITLALEKLLVDNLIKAFFELSGSTILEVLMVKTTIIQKPYKCLFRKAFSIEKYTNGRAYLKHGPCHVPFGEQSLRFSL